MAGLARWLHEKLTAQSNLLFQYVTHYKLNNSEIDHTHNDQMECDCTI